MYRCFKNAFCYLCIHVLLVKYGKRQCNLTSRQIEFVATWLQNFKSMRKLRLIYNTQNKNSKPTRTHKNTSTPKTWADLTNVCCIASHFPFFSISDNLQHRRRKMMHLESLSIQLFEVYSRKHSTLYDTSISSPGPTPPPSHHSSR